MKLNGIMLSEVSQTEKDKYCIMSLVSGISFKGALIPIESMVGVA